MNINHGPKLAREIRKILADYQEKKFPIVLHFNQGMEFPEFKITIEKTDVDTYIDAKGQKWKKVK
jgi:hypothetical protein